VLATDLKVPATFDVEKTKVPFPVSSWGNDEWSNCVKASQANQTLRLERTEHRRTPLILVPDVIQDYKNECAREFGHSPASPDDQFDNGLVILYSLRNWRKLGWDVFLSAKAKSKTNQRIDLFGSLDKNNLYQLKAAARYMRGIQFGFDLPLTAQQQTRDGVWDVVSGTAPETNPGSWGGHCVYGKPKYDKRGMYVLTWGREVLVTWAFIGRYSDEAWAVVDALDSTKTSHYLDVAKSEKYLKDIGASIQ
jgi:hypothetical protein